MIYDKIIIYKLVIGFLKVNNLKCSIQVNILISIICLILKCFKKNGIVRINKVLEICEIDIIIVEYFIIKEFVYFGKCLNLFKKIFL